MPSMDGEFQFTEKLGQEITGKLLRPCAFETVSALSLDTGVFAIAITIFPPLMIRNSKSQLSFWFPKTTSNASSGPFVLPRRARIRLSVKKGRHDAVLIAQRRK